MMYTDVGRWVQCGERTGRLKSYNNSTRMALIVFTGNLMDENEWKDQHAEDMAYEQFSFIEHGASN